MEVKARFDPVMYVYDKILSKGWGKSRRAILKACKWFEKRGGVKALIPRLAELEKRGLIKEVMLEGENGQFSPHYFDPDEYTDELERDAIQHEYTDTDGTRDRPSPVTPQPIRN